MLFSAVNSSFASENRMILEVKSGDTLSAMLNSTGVSISDVANSIAELKKVYSPRNLKIGQKINISLDINDKSGKDISLKSFSIKISALQDAKVEANEKGEFVAKKISRPLEIKLFKANETVFPILVILNYLF